jgi:hypothetical protein
MIVSIGPICHKIDLRFHMSFDNLMFLFYQNPLIVTSCCDSESKRDQQRPGRERKQGRSILVIQAESDRLIASDS